MLKKTTQHILQISALTLLTAFLWAPCFADSQTLSLEEDNTVGADQSQHLENLLEVRKRGYEPDDEPEELDNNSQRVPDLETGRAPKRRRADGPGMRYTRTGTLLMPGVEPPEEPQQPQTPAPSYTGISYAHLPQDVICVIFRMMDATSILKASHSCRHFRQAALAPQLWRSHTMKVRTRSDLIAINMLGMTPYKIDLEGYNLRDMSDLDLIPVGIRHLSLRGVFFSGTIQWNGLRVAGLLGENPPLSLFKRLKDLTSLETLDLSRSALRSLAGLPVLPSLRAIDLSWNQVRDVSALANQPALTHLALADRIIATEAPLEGMTQLKAVVLDPVS